MSELRSWLEFAIDTAYLAGRATLAHFGTGVTVEQKADDTPVTIADREAERLVRQQIAARFPQHGIIGEEHGETNPGAALRWLIDPIDGTKSFMRGVPLYGLLLGLERDGVIVAGVSYFPALDEMVYAAAGEGCYRNGRRCWVRDSRSLSEAVVAFTDAGGFARHGREAAWQRILQACYYPVGWSDAYGHMLVATGRIELMLDPAMNPWDCGPFPVLLREAGGFFGDWAGNETVYAGEALSTTQQLLPEVLSLIKGPEKDPE